MSTSTCPWPRHRIAGCLIGKGAGCLDLGCHIGQHMLHGLMGDDGLAEGDALIGILDRLIERAGCKADGLNCNARAGHVKSLHGDHKAHAFLAEHHVLC